MNEQMKGSATPGAGRTDEVDAFLDAYGASMRQSRVPAEVHDKVARAIAEREAAARPSTAPSDVACLQGAKGRKARRVPMGRRFALAAASAAVIVLAGGAAVSLGTLPGQPAASPQEGAEVVAPADQGNFFALKAWAEETPQGAADTDPTEPVGIDWLHPAFVSSWRSWEGDPVFGDMLSPGEGLAYFEFDSECEGENLVSVTYTIDNPNAFFEYFDWEEVDGLKAAGDDPLDAVEMGPSFTLTYGEGGSVETAHTRLYAIAPLSEEYDENPHAVEAYEEASRVLDGTTLTLTATFEDGTTQEKVYRIAVADDFSEKCAQFLQEYFAAWDVAGPKGEEPRLDSPDVPKLFTLQLLSER